MSKLPSFRKHVDELRAGALARIDNVPIAVLVWGPNPNGPDIVARTRLKLRDELRSRGHLANFSEELCNPGSKRSLFAQQVAQAEAYDIIFSIPGSLGSVGEIHDFSKIPGISNKIITFIDEKHQGGYSAKSLIQLQTIATSRVQIYNSKRLPRCIIDAALDEVSRLQEVLYVFGRR